MTIDEAQEAIIDELAALGGWMEKYEYLIGLGRSMSPGDDEIRVEEYEIPGCQSDVWIRARLVEGRIRFLADSDSLITRGMLALLLRVLDGRTPAEVAGADLFFITRTGLSADLSPTRANGLASIARRMKSYGEAFLADGGRNAGSPC